MKARAKAPFLDLQENVDRATGEVFECSEERFEEINSTRFGTLAERVAEEPEQAEEPEEAEEPEQAEEPEEPARKPARRKKAAPAADEAGEE